MEYTVANIDVEMVNIIALISSVRAPMQASTDYGSQLFLLFPKRKRYCLVKRFLFTEFFKQFYLKSIIANAVNLCF